MVEYWFDVVCPYAYLASTQMDALARRTGADVRWRPFLLGGVFRAIGAPDAPSMPEAKARMNLLDMTRWADWFGVKLEMPAAHPRRTLLAMRAVVAADERGTEAAKALFDAYWARGLDITEHDVVCALLDEAGLDGAALVDAAGTSPVKDALRAETDEAVSKGVFGAPSFWVDGQLFWGQDRLAFVEKALGGWKARAP